MRLVPTIPSALAHSCGALVIATLDKNGPCGALGIVTLDKNGPSGALGIVTSDKNGPSWCPWYCDFRQEWA